MQSQQKESGVAINNSIKRQERTSSNENNSVYPENPTVLKCMYNTRVAKTSDKTDKYKLRNSDFPSSQMAKTPCSQYSGHQFDPSTRN